MGKTIALLWIGVWMVACGGAPAAPPQLLQPKPVGRLTRTWLDEARPRWTGSGPRPLNVVIWYPAESGAIERDWTIGAPDDPLFRIGRSSEGARPDTSGGRRALIVMSHGTGGSAAMLAWLAEPLARSGYIVAAVNHHGNTSAEEVPAPEGFMLWWERATDVSRVLDRLAGDPELEPLIDQGRIGAAGFSLGGYTVLALAGARASLDEWARFCASAARDATCDAQPEFPEALVRFDAIRLRPDVRASLERHSASFRDQRIRAVLALAPVGSWLTEASLRAVGIPVRVIVGSHDAVTPAVTNGGRIAGLIPSARMSLRDRVGHYTFLAECGAAGQVARADLCRDEAGVVRADLHRAVAEDAVAFFGALSESR